MHRADNIWWNNCGPSRRTVIINKVNIYQNIIVHLNLVACGEGSVFLWINMTAVVSESGVNDDRVPRKISQADILNFHVFIIILPSFLPISDSFLTILAVLEDDLLGFFLLVFIIGHSYSC